jgi:hypothetical protein
MVTKLITTLLLSTFLCGCYQHKINLSNNIGFKNQLKLNGFYYTSINPKTKAVQKFFLYENGVVLNMKAFDSVDLLDLEKQIQGFNKYHTKQKNNYLSWGVFELKSNKISLTKWYPSSGGPLLVYVKRGEILNDSTFVIKWYETTKGKKIKDLNDVYHFHKYSPKPDSTNNLIK